jgi:hypothetical protein
MLGVVVVALTALVVRFFRNPTVRRRSPFFYFSQSAPSSHLSADLSAFSPSSALSDWLNPPPPTFGPPERVISRRELAKHIVKESAWVSINGQVWE